MDTSALGFALDRLENTVGYTNAAAQKSDINRTINLRAGSILAFGNVFDLAVKMIKRYIEANDGISVDRYSFN